MSKILITGSAGFIGFHLVTRFLEDEDEFQIIGLDVINDYYDVNLKYARLSEHGIQKEDILSQHLIKSSKFPQYSFIQTDLADHDFMVSFMQDQKFDYVVNLAAQAGVRYSMENPRAYTHSNINGFLSILEGCRHSNVKHLVYASSSSVYGLNTKMPLSEQQATQHPMSLYAATKKANEMMAHTYSHLFNLPTTGLRFFTVYGPWGRPDMALFLFTEAIINNKPIKVFNHGKMVRDFTYVEDIVESVKRLVFKPAKPSEDWNAHQVIADRSSAPYRVFNIGNNNPVQLSDYILAVEEALNKRAICELLEMQPGDVPATHADASALEEWVNYKPETSVSDGVKRFVDWYTSYYKGVLV
ncbi:MAG: NAD-dependent epimerase [Algoriphagus sp.]|uniref:NAD-dependent epimerase n=1 Tax=Algoriphagus sp. TaxID=1872435 RepID=UPI0026309755|nr:NAD-dependent epimerase [Algoriphagus sp.]MDG1278225.1 NAD-dependent epimerase [Algoriphagus sp.]